MTELDSILQLSKSGFSPLLSVDLSKENVLLLDLSKGNPDLQNDKAMSTADLAKYIQNQLRMHHKSIAVGGYGEDRIIYQKSEHFGTSEDARSIHLGIDIWCSSGTEVFAPLQAKVHSFQDNNNFGDYGPTILLEHSIGKHSFYTLYGHLSHDSLLSLKLGQIINKGQKFASIGHENENGSWPPHLHFQVIRDMENHYGDYPGVCRPSEKNIWLEKCPNPEVFIP